MLTLVTSFTLQWSPVTASCLYTFSIYYIVGVKSTNKYVHTYVKCVYSGHCKAASWLQTHVHSSSCFWHNLDKCCTTAVQSPVYSSLWSGGDIGNQQGRATLFGISNFLICSTWQLIGWNINKQTDMNYSVAGQKSYFVTTEYISILLQYIMCDHFDTYVYTHAPPPPLLWLSSTSPPPPLSLLCSR